MRTYSKSAGSLLSLGVALLLIAGLDVRPSEAADPVAPKDNLARGKEIFHREWLPDDTRTHGGDGLGPAYNDTSCIACHNLGASGGAGPANKDVLILSAFPVTDRKANGRGSALPSFAKVAVKKLSNAAVEAKAAEKPNDAKVAEKTDDAKANSNVDESKAPAKTDADELARFHPGFRAARSVVVHRYGTDPLYAEWRQLLLGPQGMQGRSRVPRFSRREGVQAEIDELRGQVQASERSFQIPKEIGGFQIISSRRNTSPLFGSGLIDSIPDAVIEAGMEKTDTLFPETRGRVSRFNNGKVGRFGWKGQSQSLEDFVLTACSVELGLEVPGHGQGTLPNALAYKPPGLDLDSGECSSLVAYVRSIPAPVKRESANAREKAAIRAGEESFRAVGCASCHVPKLGAVENIYSDLLLHDMGETLGDNGSYGVFINDSPSTEGQNTPDEGKDVKQRDEVATRKEWRTPPLWGFRDSGPYLHDGRAENLEQAVAFHDGQAARSAQKFFELSTKQRMKVEVFLKSLTAPADASQ